MANQYTKAKELAAQQQQAPESISTKPMVVGIDFAEGVDLTREQRQSLAGIPDSKPSVAPEGTFEQARILLCHVRGIPVTDMIPQRRAAITYDMTDEGIAERDRIVEQLRAEGKLASGKIEFPSVEQEERSRFDEMRDRLKAGASVEDSRNPLDAKMKEHTPPGMHGRWMDPETCDQLGMRGYTPLKKDGELIKGGQSFLAVMPMSEREALDRRKIERNNARMRMVQESVTEQVRQLDHAAKAAGLPGANVGPSPLPAGLHITKDLDELAAHENRR